MPNKLNIINMALLLAGEEQIADIDDDSKPANTAKAFWDLCLQSLISRHDWSWSIKRVTLSPDTEAPDFGYTAKFLLPDDFNHIVINIIDDPEEEEFDYRIEGEFLHYSSDTLELRYSANITNVIILSAMASEALTYLLAAKIAAALSSSPEKPNVYLGNVYENRLSLAVTQDPVGIGILYSVESWPDTR
jgi:hypothetical protein